MNTTINSENETEFHSILNVIKEIIAASKQPDNQAILDHINERSATNMDCNHVDKMISSMLEKQLIFDKTSKKGTSYYIMEQMNAIDNNTNNTNDDQITNIDNTQELTINTSDNDEKSTRQCSCEPVINEDINIPTGLKNKRSNYNTLEDNITSLKADMIAMKNFIMQEIFNITQRIKNVEQTNCKGEVKDFREENNSKNEIIQILSKNISSTAISTNTQVQHREIRQTSNSSNDMLYQVPKKIAKQHNSSNGNSKILTSPNRFGNLRLQDDSTNMSFQNKRTDNPSFISKPHTNLCECKIKIISIIC